MHLHDSLCFDTGYDISSWPGGFTGLVRLCEGAEPFQPKTAWVAEEPVVWAATDDPARGGLSSLTCQVFACEPGQSCVA